MELKEARARAKRCREVKSQGAAFTWTEDAAIALDNRITELEVILDNRVAGLEDRLNRLLSDAVPDKKWNKVFQGSAIDYLRHRAAHFIKNYGDPVRGARMNQLANELEEKERQFTELETERLHLRTLIRGEQIKPPFDIEDDVTTELAVALADMGKQRDELVKACKELIIESVNNITNEGHDGIEANKTDIDLIEKVTGEMWQEMWQEK